MTNPTDNAAQYREAAGYDTAVRAAHHFAEVVAPADCLAYELKQYLAAFPQVTRMVVEQGPQLPPEQLKYNTFRPGVVLTWYSEPEIVPDTDPEYPRLWAEHRAAAEQQLQRAYALHSEELAAAWATAQAQNPPDERFLLALRLKQSAEQLAKDNDYLARVRSGLPPRYAKPHHAQLAYACTIDSGRYQGLVSQFSGVGKIAAELAHFSQLLATFHEKERPDAASLLPDTTRQPHAGASGDTPESAPPPAQLSLRQVALLYIFNRKPAIKRDERANEIARQYGHNSGARLYGHYCKLSKPTGITGLEGKEIPDAIKAIEGILPLLFEAPKQAANEALRVLRVKDNKI